MQAAAYSGMLPQEIAIVLVDHVAREVALRRWALPECLHVPIAAVDEEAIRRHIGNIARVVVAGTPNKALLVHVPPAPPIDPRLPIFDLEASRIFFAPEQVSRVLPIHAASGSSKSFIWRALEFFR
jgi:hypothetical protein